MTVCNLFATSLQIQLRTTVMYFQTDINQTIFTNRNPGLYFCFLTLSVSVSISIRLNFSKIFFMLFLKLHYMVPFLTDKTDTGGTKKKTEVLCQYGVLNKTFCFFVCEISSIYIRRLLHLRRKNCKTSIM